MTQNMMGQPGSVDWKVRALNVLWQKLQTEQGLLVTDVAAMLRRIGIDWLQYTGQRAINIREWILEHFPFCFTGQNDNTIVFRYVDREDYAAVVMRSMLPSLPPEKRMLPELLAKLGAEYGLSPGTVNGALARYPRQLVRDENGMISAGERIVVPMSSDDRVKACMQEQIITAIEASESRRVLLASLPAEAPWVQGFYSKGGLGNWLESNFPKLAVAEDPEKLVPAVMIRGERISGTKQDDNVLIRVTGQTGDEWTSRALHALWHAAQRPEHVVTAGEARIEVGGLVLDEVEQVLETQGVKWFDWRDYSAMTLEQWLIRHFPVCLRVDVKDGVTYKTVLFQTCSLVDYAASVAFDFISGLASKQTAMSNLLREVGRLGVTAELIQQAFEAYASAFRLDQDVCILTGTQVCVPAPEHMMAHTEQIVREALMNAPQQALPLYRLYDKIPWTVWYAARTDKQRKAWLIGSFPLETPPDQPNTIRLCNEKDWLLKALKDALGRIKGQYVWLTELAETLGNPRFGLAGTEGGALQPEWLDELVDDQSVFYTPDHKGIYSPLPEGNYPAMPLCSRRQVLEESSQAYGFCHILEGAMATINRMHIAEADTYKSQWNRYLSRMVTEALSGVEGKVLYDMTHSPVRAVLPLRLKTPDDEALYLVMEVNESGKPNHFHMLDVVAPGMNDSYGLGSYLCERFGMMANSSLQNQFASLKNVMDSIAQQQESLLDDLENARNLVSMNRGDLPEGLVQKLYAWQDSWQEADGIITRLGWKQELGENALSMDAIVSKLQVSNVENQMMLDAIALFDGMAGRIDLFIEEELQNNPAFKLCREQISLDRHDVAGSRASSTSDVRAFAEMLRSYQALSKLAGASAEAAYDGSLISDQQEVCRHFRMPPFFANQFVGVANPLYFPDSKMNMEDELAKLSDTLNDVIRQLTMNRKQADSVEAVDVGVLVAQMEEQSRTGGVVPVSPIYPSDPLEAAIVRGDMTKAAALVQDDESLTADEKEQMLCAIREEHSNDTSLNLTTIGRRLLRIVGNRNQSAERYLLTACLQSRNECVEARRMLMDIYRSEKRPEVFASLFQGLEDEQNPDNQSYYFCVLCASDSSDVREYLNKHFHLISNAECLDAARKYAARNSLTELAAMLEPVQALPEEEGECGEAAQAIADGSMSRVQELVDQAALPEGIDAKRLRSALYDADALPGGSSDADAGRRLYICLGNWNRMAERRLWRALSSENWKADAEAASCLVQLLAEEGRWAEGRLVYEHYSREYAAPDEARRACLLCLLNIDPMAAAQRVSASMQDVFELYLNDETGWQHVAALRESSEMRVARFFERVCKLCEHLNDELARMAILPGRYLREMLAQPEKMLSLGLSEAEDSRIKQLRRTNDYPRENDPLSIAERVYLFIGCRGGVAEAFASFAMPNPNAAELLRKIYLESDEQQELIELMRTSSALRHEHWDEYCGMLLALREDAYLREAFDERPPQTAEQKTMAHILSLRMTGEIGSDELCPPEIVSEHPDLALMLACELGEHQLTDELYRIASTHAESMLRAWSAEDVRRMLTADGRLTAQQLAAMQERALQDGCGVLAIFLWNHFQLGDLQAYAGEMYDGMMLELAQRTLPEQRDLLAYCQKLFPDHSSHLAIQGLLIDLPQGGGDDSAETAAALISEKLKDAELTETQLSVLLSRLAGSLLAQESVLNDLIRMCDTPEKQMICLKHCHQVARDTMPENELFANFLARLYRDVLAESDLPEQMLAEAADICTTLAVKYRTEYTVLALVCLELRLGHMGRADFVLREAIAPREEGGSISESYLEASEVRWPNGVPTLLELFTRELRSKTTAEVMEYCRFCARFVENMADRYAVMVQPEALLTDAECDQLLYRLFARHEDAACWQQCADVLPVQGEPEALAHLMMISCMQSAAQPRIDFSGLHERWMNCADFCADRELDEMLLKVLIGWGRYHMATKHISRRFDLFVKYCRYLNDYEKENGGVPEIWTTEACREDMLALQQCYMSMISNEEGSLQRYAILACSIVTAAVNDAEALNVLLENKRAVLLNQRPSLTVALIARLLLAGRCGEAKMIIGKLAESGRETAYLPLLKELLDLDDDACADWCSASGNRSLLNAILPNGEVPPLEVCSDTLLGYVTGEQSEGTRFCDLLCRAFPKNKSIACARFFMLQNDPQASVRQLHDALVAIIENASGATENDWRDVYTISKYAYMLAATNALMQDMGEALTPQEIQAGGMAGTFLSMYCMQTDNPGVEDRINNFQLDLNNALLNQPEERRLIIHRLIRCWITGDWTQTLKDAWNSKGLWASLWQIIEFPFESFGYVPSAIEFLHAFTDEDLRRQALEWLSSSAMESICFKKGRIEMIFNLMHEEDAKSIEPWVMTAVRYPLENTSLCRQILNRLFTPDVFSDMDAAKRFMKVVLGIMHHETASLVANTLAYQAFEAHEDRKAMALYTALEWLALSCNIIWPENGAPAVCDDAQKDQRLLRLNRLKYLMALMSEDVQLRSECASYQRKYEYLNLLMQLLNSKRANEALLFRQKMPKDLRCLVDHVLMLIARDVSDVQKMAAVEAVENDYVRTCLLFLMGVAKPGFNDFVFLRGMANSDACKLEYDKMRRRISIGWFDRKNLRPNIEVALHQIQPMQDAEDEPETAEAPEQMQEQPGQDAAQFVPEFVGQVMQEVNALCGITPCADAGDQKSLADKYAAMPYLTPETRIARCEAALLVYRCSLAGSDWMTQLDWLIRYSLDSFSCLNKYEKQDIEKLLTVIPAVTLASEGIKSAFREAAVSIARAVFSVRYDALADCLSEYQRHKAAYAILKNMMPEESAKVIGTICRVMDELIAVYEKHNLSEVAQITVALQEAGKQLQNIPYSRALANVTMALHSLLIMENNKLNAIPNLSIRVLNRSECAHDVHLYGQVENKGRSEARHIYLWLTQNGGKPSEPQYLAVLAQGAKGVFDFGCEDDPDDETLSWQIDASCQDKAGNVIYSAPVRGELTLNDRPLPEVDTEMIKTDTITYFTLNEAGTDVESPAFIGRESEKYRLRSLYAGKPFVECRNAVVYGIRRSGKSSLLNYIRSYLELTREDLVPLYIDVHAINTVYRAFVGAAMSAVKGKMANEVYEELESKWKHDEDRPDFDPLLLPEFYRELKQALGGRGVVLIIDEFDRLLQKLEASQVLETSFYPVLSSMLCDPVCAQTVHFIFCGSKELKIEMNKDHQVTQVFQRIGETDITIGAMPRQDMIEMVIRPYRDQAEVQFTEEALEWLWRMTGGLVWFSKLVAKKAVENAANDKHLVVYPNDIYSAVCFHVQDDNCCKQFFEGFREDERLVVEALGNLAVQPEQYVAISQIVDLLKDHMPRERVERAIRNVVGLEIVEYHRQNAGNVRFRVEIYRRYFRTTSIGGRTLPRTEDQDVLFKFKFD